VLTVILVCFRFCKCSIINYKTCQLIDIWVVIFSGLVYFSNLPDMKLNDIIMEF
jgi:hypothetical protein